MPLVRTAFFLPAARRKAAALAGAFLLTLGPAWADGDIAARDTAQARLAMSAVPPFATQPRTVRPVSESDSFIWVARRDDRSVRIRGMVASEDDRMTVLGMIKANMPDLDIEDRLEVEGTPADRQSWLGAVSFALAQAGRLKRGVVHLQDSQLTLEGEARSSESYEAILGALDAPPNGLDVSNIRLLAPVAEPYTWRAQLEDDSLILSGHVTDRASRAKLLERVADLLQSGAVVDRMELASGAPEGWNEAVWAALVQVLRLDDGQASLSGTTVTVEGTTRDKQLAADVAGALETELPDAFEAEARIDVRNGRPPAVPPAREPG